MSFLASDKFDNESVITRIFRMLWTVWGKIQGAVKEKGVWLIPDDAIISILYIQ